MPDSQTLGLVVAAMVAGIICFRLYSVLGRRTGHEPSPVPATRPAALPQPAQPSAPASGGLVDIQLADRSFDTSRFLDGARAAYTLIVTAFIQGKREEFRPLLSPDVFAAFDAGIAARTEPAAALVKLRDARITGSALRGRRAEITVAFTAEFATGNVVDVWTFERNLDSADPTWVLVGTSGDLPEGDLPG
ncbi:MAG TPA: Tim44/TimA family putative adaptor protein [Rhizomicrobium sp.]|nr:Tim44/TimA family putative adaptor protein [Rhizomicrobium sp.]